MKNFYYNQPVKKFILIFILLVVSVPVIFLGYLGFIPVLSTVLGTDAPRDLGIRFTDADLVSIRGKSRVKYTVLPDNPNPSLTRGFLGSRAVTSDFSSSEITSTLNNQPWKYWPYQNLQVKFNKDGSTEVTGTLVKSKVPGYASAIGIPREAADFAMKYLPADPVFYIKGRGALSENKVSLFSPEKFEIGRLPMPLDLILAMNPAVIPSRVYALDVSGMKEDLAKVDNKRELIIDYINGRLSSAFGSFYAKKAYVGDGRLFFDGTLTEEISYTP